jgi:hypothetical protein
MRVVALSDQPSRFAQGVLVRDPFGHVSQLIQE